MIILNTQLLDFLELDEDQIQKIKDEANKFARANGVKECTMLSLIPNGKYRIVGLMEEGMMHRVTGEKTHISYYAWNSSFRGTHRYVELQCHIEMPTDFVVDIVSGMKVMLNTAIL